MSFTMEPFLVFLGSVPSLILRRVCLILSTVPPLMSPCGFVYTLNRRLHSLWRILPHSLHSPSLRMSSSLCSPPRSLLLSMVDWGGDRGETALPPQRHATDCTNGWENLFVSLPFTSISPCLISLLSCGVISLKIVSGFIGFFLSKFGKTYQTMFSFSLSMNPFIYLRRIYDVFLLKMSLMPPKNVRLYWLITEQSWPLKRRLQKGDICLCISFKSEIQQRR